MKSYAVIGLGRFGTETALRLCALGEEVLAIDTDENRVNGIADRVTKAVVADATNKDVLKKLGVPDCDCVIISIGSNLAASVLTTMTVKSLNAAQIICKAHDDMHREILQKLGADQVIIPEQLVADKLAVSLSSGNIMDYIELSDKYGISECKVPSAWVGKTIHELHVRSEYGVSIIAIKNEDQISIAPSPEAELKKGQILILLGDYDSLNKIEK